MGVKLSSGDERSFFCVPISIDRQPVGALGVGVRFEAGRNYERTTKFFGVVASMIGQAVKVHLLSEPLSAPAPRRSFPSRLALRALRDLRCRLRRPPRQPRLKISKTRWPICLAVRSLPREAVRTPA